MQGLLLYALLLLGLLEASFANGWNGWHVGGGILLVTGIILRLLAISTLQHRFLDGVRLEDDHTLVTNGIYQRLRHPSETGNLCLLAGCAWLLGAMGMVMGMLFLWFPLTLWRLRKEEQLLKLRFQKEFVKYQKRSVLLLPR